MKRVIVVVEVQDGDAEETKAELARRLEHFLPHHTIPPPGWPTSNRNGAMQFRFIKHRLRILVRDVVSRRGNYTPAERHELISAWQHPIR